MPLKARPAPAADYPTADLLPPAPGKKKPRTLPGLSWRREPSSYNEKGRQWCRPSPSRSELRLALGAVTTMGSLYNHVPWLDWVT